MISCTCGRYRLSRQKQTIEEYFDTASPGTTCKCRVSYPFHPPHRQQTAVAIIRNTRSLGCDSIS